MRRAREAQALQERTLSVGMTGFRARELSQKKEAFTVPGVLGRELLGECLRRAPSGCPVWVKTSESNVGAEFDQPRSIVNERGHIC